MASTAERQKRLEEMRARAKEKDATKDRAPFAPKKNAPVSPGSKVRAENKTTPKQSGLSKRLQGDSKPSPGSKVRTEPKMGKTGKSGTMPKVMRGGTADAATKKDPLAGKPRSIGAAKKAGEKYFFDKQGVKKLAVTSAELNKYMKEKGITSTAKGLRSYANTFAPKKVTKAEAEKFKKKRGGGVIMMKKKGAAGGGAMKKKGMAAGGRTTMKKQLMRGGGMTGMKKKMYAGGGKMKKGYAIGGAMKKKGMKKGGKTMKMRGGGLATRGTNFTIR